METNLVFSRDAFTDNPENAKIKEQFLKELNRVYSRKIYLIAFLKDLADLENFQKSKDQLENLQQQLRSHLAKLNEMHRSINDDTAKTVTLKPVKFKNYIITESENNTKKGLLALLVYILMIQKKESSSFKKLRQMALTANYRKCLFMINNHELTQINLDNLICCAIKENSGL